MSATITTHGMVNGPISTPCVEGESVRTWVRRHNEDVEQATPAEDKLETTWPSAAGDQSILTTRTPGESNEIFTQRHIVDYTLAMLQHPPVEHEPSRSG